MLTGAKSDEVVARFVPPDDPVFIDRLGVWYTGGGFYRLWKHKDGTRLVTYARESDAKAAQFLVKAWPDGREVTNDESLTAMAEHAKGYRELVLSSGVLKKTRFHDKGVDAYYSPHQFYQAEHRDKKVHLISKSLFVGNRHTQVRKWHPRVVLWPTNPRQLETEAVSRKDAELIICKEFLESLKRALTSGFTIDPDLKKANPVYFHFGCAKRIFDRAKKKAMPGLEKLDISVGMKENVFSLVELLIDSPLRHPIALAWKVAATLIELRSMAKGEGKEILPGCVNSKDEMVRDISSAPVYAYPLGGFLRPVKEEFLANAAPVAKPVFGELSLFKRIHRISGFEEDGINGFSAAYLGPTIGSTVRFYWNPKHAAKDEPAEAVGAIKIFRPDGLTVTIFDKQTRVWVSYEPERQFEKNSSIPDSIMKELADGGIIELLRTPSGLKARPLTFSAADLIFRKTFGDAFRTPHRPAPEASKTELSTSRPAA